MNSSEQIMAFPSCISMPQLHAGPLAGKLPGQALQFWPGLPDMPGSHWQPDNYPFDPAMAQTLLSQLAGLNLRDLETMRMTHNALQFGRSAHRLAEMADLARFAENCELSDNADSRGLQTRLILEQAQKTLLWLWLQEERLLEIDALTSQCEGISNLLESNFAEQEPARAHLKDEAALDASLLQAGACALPMPLFFCRRKQWSWQRATWAPIYGNYWILNHWQKTGAYLMALFMWRERRSGRWLAMPNGMMGALRQWRKFIMRNVGGLCGERNDGGYGKSFSAGTCGHNL